MTSSRGDSDEQNTMSRLEIDNQLFKLMLDAIPKFDGGENSVKYEIFKKTVINLKDKCNSFQMEIFNSVIYSKLEGKALRAVINRSLSNIDDILFVFNSLYVSEKSFDHAIWELFSINPNALKNVKDLYSRVAPLRDLILSSTVQQSKTKEGKEIIGKLFEKLVIGCFIRKLSPEISNLALQNSYGSLEAALDQCVQFEQIIKFRNIENKNVEPNFKPNKNKIKTASNYKTLNQSFTHKTNNNNTSQEEMKDNNVKNKTCSFCKKVGHLKETCYKYKNRKKENNPINVIDLENNSDPENDNDNLPKTSNLNLLAETDEEGTDSEY